MLAISDGQQVGYQWCLCAVIVEERLGPVAFLPADGFLEPLILRIVIAQIGCVLRLLDDTVTTQGVGCEQASFLGIIVFNKIDATAADVWIQLDYPVDDVIHPVGLVQVFFNERCRIDGRHVEVGRDAPHMFVLSFQDTFTDA